MISKTEKIEQLKKYNGWDDKFVSKLTPVELESAYHIMLLELDISLKEG
jgi:hypothetical protein